MQERIAHYFSIHTTSWNVLDESAVLGIVAGCSSQSGLVLQPYRERRGSTKRSAQSDSPVFLDERSPAHAHQKPQASPVRVDLSMNPHCLPATPVSVPIGVSHT